MGEKRQTRVVLLLNQMALSGAPKVALQAFEAMAGEIELQTVALDGGALEERFRKLGSVRVLSRLSGAARHVPRAATLRIQGKLAGASARRFRPDVIYANSAASLHMMKYLDLGSAPCLLHVHECGIALDAYARHFPHRLLEWPARYIAVSQAVQNGLEHHGAPREKIALIHAFINREEFDATPFQAPSQQPFLVGGAGHISWCKGPELWLQMAFELRRIMGDDVRFMWVGVSDNRENREFREMARKLHLEDAIQFVPLTPRPLEHFAMLDVFALSSWEDSCPLVVLENMMLGKPVVCFRGGGGAAEEVGETGIVVEEFSSRAMAEAIASLAASPQRRQSLGKMARARVLAHFEASVQIPLIRQEILDMANTRQ